MADVEDLQKLKLAELKAECEARDLDIKGNKADLIARLQAYLEEHGDDCGDVNEDDVLGEDTEDFPKPEDAADQENNKEEVAVSEEAAVKKVVKITPPVSVDEKLQKRAERFNVPASAESKKAIRAARFGLPVTSPSPPGGVSLNSKTPVMVSAEQLKKRAERFGGNVSSISKKVEEDEKLIKRKERFGVQTSGVPASADVEAKKQKRSERFGKV
ncbi:SAP domain-containing ribonucleoprotein-like isoform X2 [Osmerus mordax]|uniref:Nuclear protein Hcc-1 n=1 Tax=Osmerus mordax TaxID=8014 RepID=C1BKI2_OSMMO|nr:Nuclear protein Hcc-1 [Osmerus mordax]